MRNDKNKVKKLILENNKLREQLNNENKKYYEKLLVYIRTAGMFYDDYETENLLLEILQDSILAQKNGESIEDFFGRSPQEEADELIRNLGHESKTKILKFTGIIFCISIFFPLLSMFNGDKGINPIIIILDGILSLVVVNVIFFIMHKGIYKNIIKNKITSFILIWISFSAVIALFVVIDIFTPDVVTLYIPNSMKISMISVLIIASTFIILKRHEDKNMIRPFLLPVWSLGIYGILSNIESSSQWMKTENGKIISIVFILGTTVVFYILTYFLNREEVKEI